MGQWTTYGVCVTAPAPSTTLPSRARVVIIGGGAIGTSIAYHLAHEGITDVVLLERDRLTSGTTWHAAGLMTAFGNTSSTSTEIRMYTRDLFSRLEAETGMSTGFRRCGLVEALDESRMEEYRRAAIFQRRMGLESHEVSPKEMAELFPFAQMDGLVGGFWVPDDGRVNPVDLTMAYAKGARNLGVRILEGVTVERVITTQGSVLERVTGVRTSAGDIECEFVVNCAGMWARQLGERNGVVIPNQAAEHYYLITDTIDGLTPDHPVFEDPGSFGYYREEGGGMMVGIFEPEAAAWQLHGIPDDASFTSIPFDMERMAPFVETTLERVPVATTVGIRTFFCGPESFTPDHLPAVGEAPGIRGYFVCAGLNSVGILTSGGWGRVMAHWIATGDPGVDVTGWTVDRFRDWQLDPRHREARTAETLGKTYAAHPPGEQLFTCRGVYVSPVYDRLVAQGGFFKDVSGWEGAEWFAGAGETASAEPGWGPQPWFEHWGAEHRAVREAVGLFDLSFMTKLRLTGPGAGALLERLSTARVDGSSGRITYTQWLNEWGGIEADLTITKVAEDDFLVISSDNTRGEVIAWLQRAREDFAALGGTELIEVTQEQALLSLQGPRSRDVLAALTDADVSSEAWAFRDSRDVSVAGIATRVTRITYVGELGYELLVARAEASALYDALLEAGEAHGIRPAGLKALASLRQEKGYRDYAHDIDNTDSLVGAGLALTADLDKPGGFLGIDVVRAELAAGAPTARLVSVTTPTRDPLLFHGEVVLRDGVAVGDLRAGSIGWTVGGGVGLAFVHADGGVSREWLESGTFELDVNGTPVPARLSLSGPYDPAQRRVREA